MSGLLHERVCLITGGARGIGRAVAMRFSCEGATGLSVDLDAALARSEPVPGFEVAVCDVTSEASLSAAVDAALSRFGRLDCVVANAGLVPRWSETESIDLEAWHTVMAVNAAGVAATLKYAVPAMKARGGSVVVMASINAFTAHPRQMLYTASKHAALGIVRAAALDLGRYGIRVNAVAPGPIATEALMERVRHRAVQGMPADDAMAALAAQPALGRIATADEVAKAVAFLCSDYASGITGEILPVDAGLP